MLNISIELEKVTTSRNRKQVLHIETLRVDRGELVAVLGSNGAGKSTLLQVVNLLLPWEGQVRLFGEVVTPADVLRFRRRSALVFQEPHFIADTVFANVALPLKFRGFSFSVMQAKVKAALDTFRCMHLMDRLAHNLSGGEAQRVCLARALVYEPELLLLDEPFTALDPATRQTLLDELRQAAVDRNITVLFVSHNLDDVLQFADRALVLEEGRIIQDDVPEGVLRRPASVAVARLIGADNIIPCRTEPDQNGTTVHLASTLSVTVPERVTGTYCCLPGDAFHFDGAVPAYWLKLPLIVKKVSPSIGVTTVCAESHGLQFTLKISMREQSLLELKPGMPIQAAVNPADIHMMGDFLR